MARGPRSNLWVPEKPLTALRGINVTASAQTTTNEELSGGQNVFTDMTGAAYSRPGSKILGGIIDIVGYQGGWVFRDNNQLYVIVGVIKGVICEYIAPLMVPVPGAPTLSTTLPVNGVFFPDVNKFYITNGTDSVVQLDQSTGSLVATSMPSMQKSLYLGYNDHHLYFLNLPSQPNVFAMSDLGAITMNAASVTATQGFILGMANLDTFNAILVTDQMAYRATGTNASYDASSNLVYSPASFLPIGVSRAVAPRSIVYANNRVYWVGLDDFNNAEIYTTDGQQILPVGWEKIKIYLKSLNISVLTNACATRYGYYVKFAVPGSGSAFNNTELLLDTARTVSYTESGLYGPPSITWEPMHLPGYNIAQYASWHTAGQDYILGFDAVQGTVHQTGVNNFDESPIISTIPAPGSSPTTGSITVTPTTPISQPFIYAGGFTAVSAAVAVSAFSAGSGTVLFDVQTDSAGIPSGTSLGSFTVGTTSTPLPMLSGIFSPTVSVAPATLLHLVITPTGGNLTVTKISTATLSNNYLQKSGGTWPAGTGNPIMQITQEASIDASAVWTTAMEQPLSKKKMTRFLINGTSALGASMTVGIGNQGADSIFTTEPFSLGGGSSLWGNTATGGLIWAATGASAGTNNTWASSTSNYEITVFAPWYSDASHYISIQFRSVGIADWRINSYFPIANLVPTTIAP